MCVRACVCVRRREGLRVLEVAALDVKVRSFGVPDVGIPGWAGAVSLRAGLSQGMDEDSVRLLHGGAVLESEVGSRAGSEQERRSCGKPAPCSRSKECHGLSEETREM